MTKTDRDTRRERVDRASAALKNFRAMQSGLIGYARAVTGRSDLRIEPASATHTDGTTIYFRVPMRLADNVKHDRKLCDKRDPITLEQLCEACLLREEILCSMYHEIAHIAYHSFAPFTEAERRMALKHGTSLRGEEFADKMLAKLRAFEGTPLGNTFMALANTISTFLPPIVNILEDVRIDQKMYDARPGIRRMRESRMRRAIHNGIESADGSMVRWLDQPLNAQLTAGLYAASADFQVEGNFAPEVVEALTDPDLHQLSVAARTARSASDVFNIAFSVLVRGKQLGFFYEPGDDEPQPEPDDQQSEEKQDRAESGPDNENDDPENSPEEEESKDEGQGENTGSDVGDEPQASEDGTDPVDENESTGSAGDSDDREGSEELGEAGTEGPSNADGGGSSGDRKDDSPSGESGESDDISGGSGSVGAADEAEAPARSGTSSDEEERGSGDAGDGEDSERTESEGSDSADPGELAEAESKRGDSSSSENVDWFGEGGAGAPEAGSAAADQVPEREEGDLDEDASSSRSDLEEPESNDEGGDSRDRGGSGDAGPGDTASGSENVHEANDDHSSSGSDPEDGTDRDSSVSADRAPGGLGVDEESEAVPRSPLPSLDNLGPAESIPAVIEALTGHHGDHEVEQSYDPDSPEDQEDGMAIRSALLVGSYFDEAPRNVTSVSVRRFDQPDYEYEDAWRGANGGYSQRYIESDYHKIGQRGDFGVSESLLGPALLMTRRAFEDNVRAKHQNNLKSGKIRGSSLAKRAPVGDPRMFRKTTLPGKKSYSVLIGVDISGSTVKNGNIVLAKRAARAQAELCFRAGIDFAIYAHTAEADRDSEGKWLGRNLSLEMYQIKDFREPWNDSVRESFDNIGSFAGNLDGHTLEFYRKQVERQQSTDKIILYYTDGKMPAANGREELQVLQRNIRLCKQQGIELLGVGIRTDSPREHGLDTVQVDGDSDLTKVIAHLEKKLVNR